MNAIDRFLDATGYGRASRAALPQDAGHRRYTRLSGAVPRPALLMDCTDAPRVGLTPEEDLLPFLRIGAHIRGLGLSAPEVLAEDRANGLLLVEDLGRETHAGLLDAGADPLPLYVAAAEALAALHAAPPPPGLPDYEAPAMTRMAGLTFLDWWWPASFGAAPSDAIRAEFEAALHAMLSPHAGADGFVHRDYFPANLMHLPDRPGARRVGIIDFQDAARGHPAYDLVSLLQDARRDVAPEVRRIALEAYLAARPGLDAGGFTAAMAAMAAQRHLRVAALWVRLARRDGKPAYLRHGPRCWALLEQALQHPATAPLRRFLDRHVPPELRRNPAALKDTAA
ncbi:aminoglycoside phosphotransferase family protein [Roseomonas marmotae]|uniref:Phosphotransferase n=1 Tax=Roseomonas marmotae TaxID=2768161 RepID=A0ABS3KCH8_9PROT|nr:phosphotransferase [Roseomonas marmotae]MBO1075174.1 phosphotransferase [Roseomonas marmotae]QTI79717.1 phosphotransferase [Roseomonas marmotae]